jgi:hypothetical protein
MFIELTEVLVHTDDPNETATIYLRADAVTSIMSDLSDNNANSAVECGSQLFRVMETQGEIIKILVRLYEEGR